MTSACGTSSLRALQITRTQESLSQQQIISASNNNNTNLRHTVPVYQKYSSRALENSHGHALQLTFDINIACLT